MSLDANLKAQAFTRDLASRGIPGVEEICLSNASPMVRIDPDEVHPAVLVEQLRQLEADNTDFWSISFRTRIVDIPVLFGDEWTAATVKRFRDRHQRPDMTDLEFAAEINGYGTTDGFIVAPDSSEFSFIEVNARIQVEHGMSELVTGVDIIGEQIRVAAGPPLSLTQDDITFRTGSLDEFIAVRGAPPDFVGGAPPG